MAMSSDAWLEGQERVHYAFCEKNNIRYPQCHGHIQDCPCAYCQNRDDA